MDKGAIVIDNGTGMMKAGFAGDEAPKSCFPNLIGKPKYDALQGGNDKNIYVGDDALEKKGILTLEYPLEHGIVTNWEHMQRIWKHTYDNELGVEPEDYPVLMTEAPMNPNENREKMIQFFFEDLKVPSFYVFTQAVLSLYASGKTTGLVVDSGDGVTHIVVVYEAYCIKHAVNRIDLAGRDLTKYLQKLLTECNVYLKSSSDLETVRKIKEKACYVALDFEQESKNLKEKKIEYQLPDNSVIQIGDQAIRCPELLFNPSLDGQDIKGIHEFIVDSVKKSDIDLRKELYQNILLSGGTSMFEGIQERLNKEISAKAPPNTPVRIIAPVERKYSVWIGGSIMATLATFQTSWITAEEYQEEGESVVHRKCF
jgi:actin-related protein